MRMLQRLLAALAPVLDAAQWACVSCDLELLYWQVLGHAQRPCFFEVPAFLGALPPDQPMAPAQVVERLMAVPCPPLPAETAPAACNLERLRQHLDLTPAQCLRLLCAYLDYGGAAWPRMDLPAPSLCAVLAAWWHVNAADAGAALDDRLDLLGLFETTHPHRAGCAPDSLASCLSMPATVVQALSLRYETDAALFAALFEGNHVQSSGMRQLPQKAKR
nr:hypothetical protein [Delftia sp. PS-11]KAJ8740805.1 hypothetical protein H9T68_22550 [Delftia sp. PS-11]